MAKKNKNDGQKIRFSGFRSSRKKTRQGRSHNTKLNPGEKRYKGQGR